MRQAHASLRVAPVLPVQHTDILSTTGSTTINCTTMAETSTSGSGPVPPTPPTAQTSYLASRYASLKANLKKYGRTGIVVYLGLSTCVTAGVLLIA